MKTNSLPSIAQPGIAAIDLDGTLLGPDLQISEANFDAVNRLKAAGYTIVIATGRHYLSLRKFAVQLGNVEWLISSQGCEVSDASRTKIHAQRFLSEDQVRQLVSIPVKRDGLVLYTTEGIYTPEGEESALQFYAGLAGVIPKREPLELILRYGVYKAVWLTEPAAIEELTPIARAQCPETQIMRTHIKFLEFLPLGVNKASALDALSQLLEIRPADSVVFGDAENDIAMFGWTPNSFGMDHGWPSALASAAFVTPHGSPHTAFARAVDMLGI